MDEIGILKKKIDDLEQHRLDFIKGFFGYCSHQPNCPSFFLSKKKGECNCGLKEIFKKCQDAVEWRGKNL